MLTPLACLGVGVVRVGEIGMPIVIFMCSVGLDLLGLSLTVDEENL
ncbi:hypothetical protein [Chamaesiphon sp.]